MSDTQAQFSVLRQTADPAVADAILQLDREGRGPRAQPDQRAGFCRANRARRGTGRSPAFCMPSRLGLFDLDLECAVSRLRRRARRPLHAEIAASRRLQLRAVRRGYEASVDEQVEVAFTVSPRVRRIAAHDPNTLPIWEYFKQVFWSSGDRPQRGIVRAR